LPYPQLTGTRVNGGQVRDIAIADLAGIELAWAAFRAAQPAATKEADQMFYRGWASLWAQHLTAEAASQQASSGVHSPGQWRANVPIANQVAFGEAYGCKAGTPMQPAAEMQVKLWP